MTTCRCSSLVLFGFLSSSGCAQLVGLGGDYYEVDQTNSRDAESELQPEDGVDSSTPDVSRDSLSDASRSCSNSALCAGETCCQNIFVPGGSFPMGRGLNGTDTYDSGSPLELPEHQATVDAFYLDTFEVTVGRFREFVEAYNAMPPISGAGDHHQNGAGWQSAWNVKLPSTQAELMARLKCDPATQSWTDSAGNNETVAINCVSWYEAFAFCLWDSARLPTEAEWEYAAAGGSDNRLYPWGAVDPAVDPTLANDKYSNDSALVRVGSHPSGKSKWGHYDLAGGMWEWTIDCYDQSWYAGAGNACSNCANVEHCGMDSYRMIRGGAWNRDYSDLRADARSMVAPDNRLNNVGFRCARAIP